MSNFCTNVLKAVQVAWGRFPFFEIFASRLSFILFTWSLHARLLILAHFMTSWIRRCCGCLCCKFYFAKYCQWYILKSSVSSSSLLLHLFVRPMSCILSICLYFMCLFFSDVDVQFSHQRFRGHSNGSRVFGSYFLRFLQTGYRPFCLVSSCLFPDSGPFCDTLNVADVANVFISSHALIIVPDSQYRYLYQSIFGELSSYANEQADKSRDLFLRVREEKMGEKWRKRSMRGAGSESSFRSVY